MTSPRRFETDLPALLADLYPAVPTDYRNDIVLRTARTRQRPAWTFRERWLPMDITARAAPTTRVPWRVVVLLALLALLIVISLVVYAGARNRQLPTPFGPARNGLITFDQNGDIYAGDPETGQTRLLVGGPEEDSSPGYSPDGTQLAFLRDTALGQGIYVANADGSGLHPVVAESRVPITWADWAPDSRHLVLIQAINAVDRLQMVDAAGHQPAQVIVDSLVPDEVQFRPPDGREMVFRAKRYYEDAVGLFAVNVDGTGLRTLIEPDPIATLGGFDLGMLNYTEDGNQILYTHYIDDQNMQLWAMNADGSNPHQFTHANGATWEGQSSVSPDGKWVAFWDGRVSVVQADGTGAVVATGPEFGASSLTADFAWSPDSQYLLAVASDGSRPYLLDPAGGSWTTLPWDGTNSNLDWQRLALQR